MLSGFFGRGRDSRGPSRPSRNRRLAGCLLWIIAIILVLIVLSLLFGGFQMGTKADVPGPQPSCQAGQCHSSSAT